MGRWVGLSQVIMGVGQNDLSLNGSQKSSPIPNPLGDGLTRRCAIMFLKK